MTSDRWSEMAAAYVAGALTESERTAMEERLETDEELRRLVAAYRGSLDDALERLPDRSPPPELRARVLARAREEAGSGDGTASIPSIETERRGLPGGTLPWLALAASVAGLLWLGTQNRSLRSSLESARTERAATEARLAEVRAELQFAEGELARFDSLTEVLSGEDLRFASLTGDAAPLLGLVWSPSRQTLVIAANDLPPLSAGRTYQLWGIPAEGDPVSLGTFDAGPDGDALLQRPLAVDADFELGAITEEPEGGSPQPTRTPFLVGSWRAAQE